VGAVLLTGQKAKSAQEGREMRHSRL
jgi:hypothetical protein